VTVARRARTSLRELLARFRRAERGAAAVEFALVAVPLFLLIFGLLQVILLFLVTVTLDNATETVSRTIRTGAFQQSGSPTKDAFRTEVCARMSWLAPNCASNLYVQAQEFNTYGALAASPPPSVDSGNFPENVEGEPPKADPLPWQPGQACSIVLVRTFYRWKMFTPLMDQMFETPGAGDAIRLVTSASAFRNEPYDVNPTASMAC